MKYICADCGHEQAQDNIPCEACHSPRVVLLTFIESVCGKDWRKTCFPREVFPESWEQAGWDAPETK